MLVKDIAKTVFSQIYAKDIKSLRIDQLDGIELVSFDIFDTLLHRSCGEPSAVFRIVEQIFLEENPVPGFSFHKERVEAERRARRKVGPNTEVTLDEIYRELPFSSQDRAELMELEIACEIAVCEPNWDVVRVYDAIRRNHTVVLASDMYLPQWVISEILRNCGIEGYDRLYLSSEYRLMKRNGALFKRVIDDYGVSPSNILHIGDHPLADWKAPKQLGMEAFLLSVDAHDALLDGAKEEKRVKVVMYSESWIIGGIESFIMNEVRHLPSGEFDITLTSTWGDSKTFNEDLERLGIRRFVLFDGSKPNLFTRTLGGLREFYRVIGTDTYDAAHINSQNGLGFAYAWLAKRRGVDVRIVHSHNAWFGEGSEIPKMIFHHLCRLLFGGSPTKCLAASEEAGKYLFGRKPYQIIFNGIDADRFTYSECARRKTREELGISRDTFVAGCVGRVTPEKDPIFQLHVVEMLHTLQPDAKYIMVGSGSLDDAVDGCIRELGLEDVVIRVAATDSPERYYFAMDAFLFPSVFEGLGIAGIEAQCAGLPVVAADHLPSQLAITDLVTWKNKEDSYLAWAESLLSAHASKRREEYAADIVASGYDATSMANTIAEFYLGKN